MTNKKGLLAASIMVPTFIAIALPALADAQGLVGWKDKAPKEQRLTAEQQQIFQKEQGLKEPRIHKGNKRIPKGQRPRRFQNRDQSKRLQQ